MRRRRFLLWCGGTALLAVLGVAGGPYLGEAEIVSHLRRRLSFLKLEEAGLQRFAHDQVATLLAKRPTWVRWKYHFLHLFSAKAFSRFDSSNDHRSRTERLVDNLALCSRRYRVDREERSALAHIGDLGTRRFRARAR